MDSGISTSETGGATSGKTFMERLKAQNARHKQQLEEKRKKLGNSVSFLLEKYAIFEMSMRKFFSELGNEEGMSEMWN